MFQILNNTFRTAALFSLTPRQAFESEAGQGHQHTTNIPYFEMMGGRKGMFRDF